MKWRLISTAGSTVVFPPPVPPPLCPNTGPKDGCLIVSATFLFNLPNPWVNPIAVVDLPSPRGVGVIAVTTTNFAFLFLSMFSSGILALNFPYNYSDQASYDFSIIFIIL